MTQQESPIGVPDDQTELVDDASGHVDDSSSVLYLSTGMFSFHPRFDPPMLRTLLERLGESWDDERNSTAFRYYNRTRRQIAVLRLVGVGFFALMVANLAMYGYLLQANDQSELPP